MKLENVYCVNKYVRRNGALDWELMMWVKVAHVIQLIGWFWNRLLVSVQLLKGVINGFELCPHELKESEYPLIFENEHFSY